MNTREDLLDFIKEAVEDAKRCKDSISAQANFLIWIQNHGNHLLKEEGITSDSLFLERITPYPWKSEYSHVCSAILHDGDVVAKVQGRTLGEEIANTALIRAAPELFKAVQLVLEEGPAYGLTGVNVNCVEKIMHVLKSILDEERETLKKHE